MKTESQTQEAATIGLVAEIVSAFVLNNSIAASSLPELISSVHEALSALSMPAAAAEPEPQEPAVSIKKSVTDDYLISLEDGRHYKSLKRHLSGRGLTPDQYREKWGLPFSYPMVAPSYARQRSEMARASGLGLKRSEPAPVVASTQKPRGRPKKAI